MFNKLIPTHFLLLTKRIFQKLYMRLTAFIMDFHIYERELNSLTNTATKLYSAASTLLAISTTFPSV